MNGSLLANIPLFKGLPPAVLADLQVDLMARHEIMRPHEKLDRLAADSRAQPPNAAPSGGRQIVRTVRE